MTRLDPFQIAPDAMSALYPLEEQFLESDLERSLAELVRLRVSQINGCAFSIHLHTRVALLRGETPARLHALQLWNQSPLFNARERAALRWTDALTEAKPRIADALYDFVRAQFSGFELASLTLLIITVSAWNRIAIGFRLEHPFKPNTAAA